MADAFRVDVVLPCLNEAAALPTVLAGCPNWARPIVVDNGSSDDSAAVAGRLGALVIREPQRGFGAACHAGLLASNAEIVCFADADASLDLRQLHRVVDPVRAGTADLMLGRRIPAPGAWPLHARLANRVLARHLSRRTGVQLRDLGPMRAAHRADLMALKLTDRRFGYPLEMVIAAIQAGLRVAECDVDYAPRTGRSKVTGTVRGTLRTVHDMRAVLAK